MKLIAEIWGEKTDFAIGEINGICEGEELNCKIINVDYPVVILEAEDYIPIKRAGLLRRLSKFIYSGSNIPELGIELEDYAIRVRKNGNWKEREIIKSLARDIEGNVNLENPRNIVRVYAGKNLHVGLELYDFAEQSFESRRAKNLPISYPITMHPRLARAMINLARVKKGARILDPFCGTGSILIEGALIGMKMHGSDIDERMLKASQTNLKRFGLEAILEKKDVGEIEGYYGAIVTDPPYGRSSSSMGEGIYKLYDRAFKKFSEVTSKVVIALPDEKSIKIGERYFELREFYPYRVHKSLTRYFLYFHI